MWHYCYRGLEFGSTHLLQATANNYGARGSDFLFWPLQVTYAGCRYTGPLRSTCIHIIKDRKMNLRKHVAVPMTAMFSVDFWNVFKYWKLLFPPNKYNCVYSAATTHCLKYLKQYESVLATKQAFYKSQSTSHLLTEDMCPGIFLLEDRKANLLIHSLLST